MTTLWRAGGIAAWLAAFALAASPARAALSPFSGFWQLQSRKEASAPQLKPEAEKLRATYVRDGSALVDELKWCISQGLPFVMEQAGPIDIIFAPHEVAVFADKTAFQRHLYLGTKTRPDPNTYDPTSVGHTLAELKGNTLTAETIGLSDGVGPVGIPRTTAARLVETFTVSGDRLTVQSTWTDDSVLRAPYRYTVVYKRLPRDYRAPESYCDPRKNGVGVP